MIFFVALFRFNAFIFIFGSTITNSELELWLLRYFGRKIIFIYVGSDARPPFIDGVWFPASDFPGDFERVSRMARKFKMRIALHEKYANYLVNSPSTAQYHERPYINWFAMGVPKASSVRGVGLEEGPIFKRPVRILHSPSNPGVKGSQAIFSVLDNLRARGYEFELIKLQGVSNDVVLQELNACDFVIDQLYSDTPMAVFATEAAHFSKPAVVGGYFAEHIHRVLPEDMIPPSLYVVPSDLEAAIERMIVDVDFRLELGRRAFDFVQSKWMSDKVAARYLKLLQDQAEEGWWSDPQDIDYVCGVGMPEGHAANLVDGLIAHAGVTSLQVADKPRLEQAFVRLARSSVRAIHD
ncbi:hypothetical protein PSQ20_00385 [Curvibacter sp. RS43]|uniref:glycosyltransferase n=1 Tax=Curvibacter microcysteis TaxID=3026419 RepID=UPI002360EE18|nr:hypothetical protein [Curvibacter sp. RS43]MDD0808781.1 hypothetical protein [Curvibacter sp. RS43]